MIRWGIAAAALGTLAVAKSVSAQDLNIRLGESVRFGSVDAVTVRFGGYKTAECRFALSIDGRYFFFKKVQSRCKNLTNSKGVKIVCTPDMAVCKTRKELIDAVTHADTSSSMPSWCNSRYLNKTEHLICSDETLSALDKKLAQIYGASLAKRDDAAQHAWLKERDACGVDKACVQRLYESKIAQLQTGKKPYDALLSAIEDNPENAAKWSEAQKNDRDLVKEAVKRNGLVLYYLDNPAYLDDRALVAAAVKSNPTIFKYVSPRLKEDKAIALEAVRQRGMLLEFAAEDLKNDRDVVFAAIESYPKALCVAGSKIRKDIDTIAYAMRRNYVMFSCADPSLLSVDQRSMPAQYRRCYGCHGRVGEIKALGRSRVLAKMGKDAILRALKAYKEGTYPGGSSMMKRQVRDLSSFDMQAIARYLDSWTRTSVQKQWEKVKRRYTPSKANTSAHKRIDKKYVVHSEKKAVSDPIDMQVLSVVKRTMHRVLNRDMRAFEHITDSGRIYPVETVKRFMGSERAWKKQFAFLEGQTHRDIDTLAISKKAKKDKERTCRIMATGEKIPCKSLQYCFTINGKPIGKDGCSDLYYIGGKIYWEPFGW